MAFYMANIYQLLAAANGTQVSIPSSLSNPALSFTPPHYAIWVNSLWFLSLSISLTCALLATLLQQWARRYIRTTQPQYSPHKRGRIRAFFAEGVDNLQLPWAVEALPALLHLSLFLFFAGVLVFLFNTSHNVFSAVAWWIALLTVAYISMTFMPLFRPESPYYAPLSSSAWFLATGVLTLLFQALYWIGDRLDCFSDSTWEHFNERGKHYYVWFVRGLSKTAEDVARKLPPAIDGRALLWTLDRSDEDQELLRFFEGIPGFCSSKVLEDPLGACIKPNMERLAEALIGLVHRTLTSSLVTPKTKSRRLLICKEAMRAARLRTSPQIFRRIMGGEWDSLLSSFEFGLFLGDADNSDPVTAYHSQAILSIILPRVREQERADPRWPQLAIDHLGFTRSELGNYLAHGDSMALATSTRLLRNIIHTHFDPFWLGDAVTRTRWKVLELVSKFDIQGTLPALQHDFCDLWNEIVHLARNSPDSRFRAVSIAILKNVRNAYITLHEGTISAPTAFSSSTTDDRVLMLSSSYPMCNIPGHIPHPLSRTHSPITLPFLPTPQPSYRTSQQAPMTSIAATTAPGTNPACYWNVTAAPDLVPPNTPPSFPIPVLDNTRELSLVPAPFESTTDSSTSLSTFPVTFPQPTTGASDRGATIDGVGSAERNDDAAGPQSMDPPTSMIAPAARSPQPPLLLRSSADVAIAGPSISSPDAEQWDQPSHSESTRKR
jgi:hypothetical protein